MAQTVHVTLKGILLNWNHPALYAYKKAEHRHAFCRAMLPDTFTNNQTYAWYFDKDKMPLSDSVLRMLVNGNRKSLSGFIHSLASVSFTDDLIHILNQNATDAEGVPPRTNLFQKMMALVSTSDPPLCADSPLFQNVHLEPDVPGGQSAGAYAQLRHTVQRLLSLGSTQAYAYAVMIYVLAAWLQWRIEEIPWLWDWDCASGYLYLEAPKTVSKNPAEHIAFEDPSYMNHYHAYLFRSTRPQLFEFGILTMEPESLFGAQIRLKLKYQSGDDPNHYQEREFLGNPTLSQKDACVYSLLKDSNGALAHLYFSYKPFNANMYYRLGLLVSKDPDNPALLSQKIVLSHRQIADWEKPYVEGILADNGDLMVLTPKMLEQFTEKFKDVNLYPWMPFFQAEVLPMLREAIRSTQLFNCQLIRSYFLGVLSELQILQITLALKSIPIPGFERQGRFLGCLDNPNTHLLLRDAPIM